jgi:acyltransferase
MNRLPPDRRNVVIDNARGMAILLVILGHVPGLASDFSKWIFSFHVPLFFIIAGMSAPNYPLPLIAYSRKLARNLLIPFLCF